MNLKMWNDDGQGGSAASVREPSYDESQLIDATKDVVIATGKFIDASLSYNDEVVKKAYLMALMEYLISGADNNTLNEVVKILNRSEGAGDAKEILRSQSKQAMKAFVAVLDLFKKSIEQGFSMRKVSEFLSEHANRNPKNGLEVMCFCIQLDLIDSMLDA